ncbi:hypothetical protein BC939DRAFT_255876 [Gamsiella multidivaricata]|uniref:uncharacterized protein n=1 Tax=Gamsiella multidivaricata TaxID=101098 RepID=UPI00221E464D|nr:uncharacterized protein BC939DRAFT_255876 [Gamsiella multidivaricata]KAG0364551.1 hypothetical protein BGZ54_007394 [Gamsiella multidivaricata]KAI7830579.1 hypothetical protein BC939DRAFT_255876 [Gamsiella multidivaricata]
MSSFEGSKSSWFMRVSGEGYGDNKRRQQYRILDREQELDTYLLAPHGHEIVFNSQKGKPLAAHQISAPSKSFPTCFARAVIGLQSRCTRPFCENLIGGGDLTEALRTKVLDVLSPSMFRFEKADPSIVHAPSAENVAVVSNDNLAVVEGESAPRSKIEVALLGRYGNTSIPNANMLEVSLLARGFAVKTIHLDYPSEISLAQAAQLFRNETILVAPQGDALGYSTLMAPGTVVVSILPRFTRSSKIYTDRMMAFGKRFFAWDCQDETCVQPDRDLAHECIEAIQDSYKQEQGISAQDFEEFANMRQDFRQRSEAWKAIANCYTRDVSRRLNVEELTTLIEGLAKDFTFGMAGNEGKKLGDEPMLMRRAGPEDDLMEGDVEEGEGEGEEEEDPAAGGDNTDVLEDDGQTEDQEEGDVRIQDDQEAPLEESETSEEGEEEEGSGQDINMHEYDEQEGPAPDAKEEEHHKAPNTPATPSPSTKSDEPSPAPAPNTPKTKPESSYYEMKYRRAEPLFGFAEFCRRGRCCGSGKISGDEASHAGGKSLTPCGHSMSRIVFGAKGAWGLTDKVVSEQEAQSLVWEVDLGRRS